MIYSLIAVSLLMAQPSDGADFSAEEVALAEFWEQMGPTLRDDGIEAYVERYHPDFTHWNPATGSPVSDRASAAAYWSAFVEAGHVITCTFVDPVTLTIAGDTGFGRLYYEQTNRYADGRAETHAFRMSIVLLRGESGWQVRETSMIRIDNAGADGTAFAFRHCRG
jgi:ketosteroid isomerase-like protein